MSGATGFQCIHLGERYSPYGECVVCSDRYIYMNLFNNKAVASFSHGFSVLAYHSFSSLRKWVEVASLGISVDVIAGILYCVIWPSRNTPRSLPVNSSRNGICCGFVFLFPTDETSDSLETDLKDTAVTFFLVNSVPSLPGLMNLNCPFPFYSVGKLLYSRNKCGPFFICMPHGP